MNKLSVREPDLLTLLTTTPSVIAASVNMPFHKGDACCCDTNRQKVTAQAECKVLLRKCFRERI